MTTNLSLSDSDWLRWCLRFAVGGAAAPLQSLRGEREISRGLFRGDKAEGATRTPDARTRQTLFGHSPRS